MLVYRVVRDRAGWCSWSAYIVTQHNSCGVINMQDRNWNMKPDQPKAIMLAKRQLSELVCDAVNLEGINCTLPEIQTLLDGVTIGGYKLQEQQIILNQAATWRHLFDLVEQERFHISQKVSCKLHAIAGKEEALEWGKFRSGGVKIAGTNYSPPEAKDLSRLFEIMSDEIKKTSDIYDRAIGVFLTMARAQFFYDVNKRMGRFMMSGLLLANGYPIINLPAKRQLEFNQLMLDFYSSNDQNQMNVFLRSCMDSQCVSIMKET